MICKKLKIYLYIFLILIYLYNSYINSWQKRYFQLKNGKLYWFKNKSNLQANNSLSLKSIKHINPIEERKFEIILGNDGKDYLLSCDNGYKRDNWVNALKEEKKKLAKEIRKKYDLVFEMEEKKRIITDKYNFPLVENNQTYMKDYIDETITSDGNFSKKEDS